jgi:hypothetical protein
MSDTKLRSSTPLISTVSTVPLFAKSIELRRKNAPPRQVSRFLESSDLALTPGAPTPALDPTIKQRLLRHLDTCVAELDLDFGLSSSAEGNRDAVKAEADSEARPDSSTTMGGDENNNGRHTAQWRAFNLHQKKKKKKHIGAIDVKLRGF